MVSVIDYTSKDPTRESHSGSGGTYMEDATMVSSPTPIIERVSSPDPMQENVVISPTQEEFILPTGVPQLAV